ncbi:hypothetical protein DTO021C3_1591 [Paecilomyces variotii]|nr:hypothetical protein DTO021C3_1591 [Paecilomyces variotii]KAJ9398126.1 hypothetical protein DTO282F9_5036 [Paecilomyces variotii]
MRGIIFRTDSFAAPLPCPGYHRPVPGLCVSRRGDRVHLRTTTTKSDIPTDVDLIPKPKWKPAPPPDRSSIFDNRFVSRQSWNFTSVLEGPSEASREEDNEPREDAVARERAFYRIIRDGQPDRVMNAMLDPQYREVVASLPSSVFVEALRILSPAYFIEPYRPIYRPMHLTGVLAKMFKPLEVIFDEFVHNLAAIIRIRHEGEQTLGLAEYQHLLDCARAMGDVEMADAIWLDMKEERVDPDIQCYNHYMEAKVWDHAFVGREKYNLRVTPYYYRKRRSDTPSEGWQGYGTGNRSVRLKVMAIFRDMTQREIPPDERTFVNLFLACCRTGHMGNMKSILKLVWNVDIDLLREENDPEKIPPATSFEPSSPLHPSERLLFAVAHGFGTNNDLQSALRVLDYVSRSYNIPVPENVWYELFERSFVLSRPRFGPDAVRNAKGSVSYDFLTALFEVMTSAPYHVHPRAAEYFRMAKTAWTRARLREFRSHMNACYDLLREVRQQSRHARSVVAEYLTAASRADADDRNSVLQSSALADAIHTYGIRRLMTAQVTALVERMARLLLIHHRFTGRDNPVFEWQILPRGLEEWADFLPTTFWYYSGTGVVGFKGKTFWGQCKLKPHNKVAIRRVARAENPEIWEEAEEVDDDFFWQSFRAGDGRNLNFDVAPLTQLVWESEKYLIPDELDDELDTGVIDDADTINMDLLSWLGRIRNTANGLAAPDEEAEPGHDTEKVIKSPSPTIPWLSLPWMRDVWARTVL